MGWSMRRAKLRKKRKLARERRKKQIPDPPKRLKKTQYRSYISSKRWRRMALAAKHRAGFKCQVCGRHDVRLQTHHVTYKRLGHERKEDLIVLCADCHGIEHEDARPATDEMSLEFKDIVR